MHVAKPNCVAFSSYLENLFSLAFCITYTYWFGSDSNCSRLHQVKLWIGPFWMRLAGRLSKYLSTNVVFSRALFSKCFMWALSQMFLINAPSGFWKHSIWHARPAQMNCYWGVQVLSYGQLEVSRVCCLANNLACVFRPMWSYNKMSNVDRVWLLSGTPPMCSPLW